MQPPAAQLEGFPSPMQLRRAEWVSCKKSPKLCVAAFAPNRPMTRRRIASMAAISGICAPTGIPPRAIRRRTGRKDRPVNTLEMGKYRHAGVVWKASRSQMLSPKLMRRNYLGRSIVVITWPHNVAWMRPGQGPPPANDPTSGTYQAVDGEQSNSKYDHIAEWQWQSYDLPPMSVRSPRSSTAISRQATLNAQK